MQRNVKSTLCPAVGRRWNIAGLFPLILCTLANTGLATTGHAQDLSGRWRGTWSSAANAKHGEHRGPLRAKFTSNGDGSYRAIFAGRFAVIVPFVYRARVTQFGDRVVASRKLGPLGEYRMQLSATPGQLNGVWNAAGENGTIGLRRR